jgi:hypothetical protein
MPEDVDKVWDGKPYVPDEKFNEQITKAWAGFHQVRPTKPHELATRPYLLHAGIFYLYILCFNLINVWNSQGGRWQKRNSVMKGLFSSLSVHVGDYHHHHHGFLHALSRLDMHHISLRKILVETQDKRNLSFVDMMYMYSHVCFTLQASLTCMTHLMCTLPNGRYTSARPNMQYAMSPLRRWERRSGRS